MFLFPVIGCVKLRLILTRLPSRQNLLQSSQRRLHIIFSCVLYDSLLSHVWHLLLAYYVCLLLCMRLTNLLWMIPMPWIVLFCPPSFGLVNCGISLCISSYRFELWVPVERHWLWMHIIILSLNGALPLYNTILAYVLHELSKGSLLIYIM